jgi:hypothetical protein
VWLIGNLETKLNFLGKGLSWFGQRKRINRLFKEKNIKKPVERQWRRAPIKMSTKT